jgi:methylenetetrahydrofolate reductase (NADPH)
MKASGALERMLRKGAFAVTAALDPPVGNDLRPLDQQLKLLKGSVDAINVTDNPTGFVRMSSLATSAYLIQNGFEPIMHLTTRDRNRIALQSDLLGATALGVRNILCLTGDHHTLGNQRDAKNVHDLDSVQLIACARTLRDEGTLMGGKEKLKGEIRLFIGAGENPFGDPFEFRVIRLAKKARAGADFIQTHPVYDTDRFREWMKAICDRGLHEKLYILAGVCPLKSREAMKSIQEYHPGIFIPEAIIDRVLTSRNSEEEGIQICVEQIRQIKEIQGVHGVTIHAPGWEASIPEIIQQAGLLPRPKADVI